MSDPEIRFGTDGIRGPAGTWPITVEVAARVGAAAARLADGGSVLVAHDPRPSSRALADAVADGVCATGATCRFGGVAPTAAVGVGLAEGLADAGVMVTASHNPAADNGFKVFGAGGHKLDDEASRKVEGWLARPPPTGGRGERIDDAQGVRATWLRSLEAAAPDLGPLRGKRLAIDLAAGAATVAAAWLSEHLPCGLVLVGRTGTVNDGVGSEHLDRLAAEVLQHGLDGGFAVDGDADRCRVVDERGVPVPGDAVAWRLATSAGASGLAVTVMSNGAIETHLSDRRIVRTPVGDRHLRIAMETHDLPLGAEESGHVLFAGHPAGDGLLTGLATLAAAFSAADRLSEAFAGFSPLPRRVTKVRVASRPPLDEVDALQRARAEHLASLGEGGRIFLRYSGTEPVLRVLVEGTSDAVVAPVSDAITHIASEVLS